MRFSADKSHSFVTIHLRLRWRLVLQYALAKICKDVKAIDYYVALARGRKILSAVRDDRKHDTGEAVARLTQTSHQSTSVVAAGFAPDPLDQISLEEMFIRFLDLISVSSVPVYLHESVHKQIVFCS